MSENECFCVEIRRNPEEFDKKTCKKLANFPAFFFSCFCTNVSNCVYIHGVLYQVIFSCMGEFMTVA